MHVLITILLILGSIVALILIIGLFFRKNYLITRSVIINVPLTVVFDYVKYLRNQNHFNKWVMADPDMQKIYKGTDGLPGFIYGWNSAKNAGEGELELTGIVEGKKIESEIRFVRPFAAIAHVEMTTEALSESQTKVTWSNASRMKYPLNVMLPMMEKMMARDMDESLAKLKRILEQE